MIEEQDLDERLPFISIIHYGKEEYVGVIINQDSNITSFYDFAHIILQEDKIRMIELCEIWWYESNHRIPINIFLRRDLEPFRYAIKSFNSNDVKIVIGPTVNISNMTDKRPKRRTVQFIRSSKA